MSDIFISYASADRERAKLVSVTLDRRGWSVWWDRTIPPHRQPSANQCLREQFRALPVSAGVADEDVAHAIDNVLPGDLEHRWAAPRADYPPRGEVVKANAQILWDVSRSSCNLSEPAPLMTPNLARSRG